MVNSTRGATLFSWFVVGSNSARPARPDTRDRKDRVRQESLNKADARQAAFGLADIGSINHPQHVLGGGGSCDGRSE